MSDGFKTGKCAKCGREFPIYHLFCVNSGRGASSLCDGCTLLCPYCINSR